MTLPLFKAAADRPDEAALVYDESGSTTTFTWTEAAGAVGDLAAAILGTDLGPTRRVLVVARNRPATVIAHAACLAGEASSVPVNFHLTAPEIRYIAEQSEARLAFADATTIDAVHEAVAELPHGIEVILLPDVGVDIAAPAAAEPRPIEAGQRVIPSLLFTSGTTGRPKAVQLPPKTIGDAPDLAGLVEHMAKHRLASLGAHLVVGPMYHNGPLTAVRLFCSGVPIVVTARFDAARCLELIETHGIESSIMVPTHFVRLLALDANVRAAADVSSLRQVAHTGGACPQDVKRAMIEWWGPVLSESYGGTESGTVCSINSTDWLAHPGSVGRAVAPFEALVVDEAGRPLPANTEGRLYFRDTTGRGITYEGDPEKTAAAHLEPGVFTLGEIGVIDDDGFVFITDRFSDMVVSGGVNIYPAEAEQALATHDAVADAACIGVPDPEMGERLVAVIQLRPDAEASDAELDAHCRASLAGYKVPRAYLRVDEVPRNPMGKTDKKALRAAHSS